LFKCRARKARKANGKLIVVNEQSEKEKTRTKIEAKTTEAKKIEEFFFSII
jgi:hypothetical protein